jgi:small subunit ribosomal protein S3Ae
LSREQRNIGFAVVSRSKGLKLAADGLKGRVYEVCLDDLQDDESFHRKIKLKVEDIDGKNLLTNFHGMDFTTDKLKSLIKKWQSLIEGFADVKTTDGYVLRIFVIGFTKKTKFQICKTSYAQSAQVRFSQPSHSLAPAECNIVVRFSPTSPAAYFLCSSVLLFLMLTSHSSRPFCFFANHVNQKRAIRAKMVDIIDREAGNCSLQELVMKFISDSIAKEIENSCQKIYPMHDVNIRKVKILKKPKFDVSRLLEIHGDAGGVTTNSEGATVTGTGEFVEPVPQESV